jgi:hypothetical protein
MFVILAKAEQVPLVVARHAFALRIEDQTGVAHLRRVVAEQRQRAADQPDAVPARGVGEKILDRAVAEGFARRQARRIVGADQRKVFRQYQQLRAGGHGLLDQPGRGGQVGRDIRAGNHLQGGESGHLPAPSAVGWGCAGGGDACPDLTTCGSAQGPVIRYS